MSYDIANAPKNLLALKEKTNKYYLENYEVDLNDENNGHSIAANAALGSKRILDVGCGAGVIGKKLKDVQKCTVDGIDIDKDALKIASKSYDQVFNIPLGDNDNSDYRAFQKSTKKYDCIICEDILEHLVNPDEVLAVLSKKLSPGGKIIVGIPNISHIDVIAGLIDGKFNYNHVGILDNTHLRFFTEESFYQFIANINESYGINLVPKLIHKTTATDEDIETGFIRDICGDELFTFQNIFQLTKEKKKYEPKLKQRHYYKKILKVGKDLSDIMGEIGRLHQEIYKRDQLIKDMKQSTSWRVTKPLRRSKDIIRRIIH